MSDHVLVVGDDTKAFLSVVRSLARLGIAAHAAVDDETGPALASRHLAALHRVPKYSLNAWGWVQTVSTLVSTNGISLIVPTSDSSLSKLARHADFFLPAKVASPGLTALAAFSNKAATRALALRVQIPVPPGEVLSSQSRAEELEARFGLPLVLKPCQSYSLGDATEKRAAVIANDRRELLRLLNGVTSGEWLVETFIAGTGVGVSVLASRGRILEIFQHKRISEGWNTGPSTSRVSVPVDPTLRHWVGKMAAEVELDGVAMFEFRRRACGDHVLLEVNPRFWGSLPLAAACGCDFPALLYSLVNGRRVVTGDGYPTGIVRRDLLGEYHRVIRVAEDGRIFRAVGEAILLGARLLSPSNWDSWAVDDPEPFRRERRLLLARASTAIIRRFRSDVRRQDLRSAA